MEEERRQKMDGMIRSQLLKEAEQGKRKKKKNSSEEEKSRKRVQESSDDESDSHLYMDRDDDPMGGRDFNGRFTKRIRLSDLLEDTESDSSTSGRSSDADRPDASSDGEEIEIPPRKLFPDEEDFISTAPSALDRSMNEMPLSEVSGNAGLERNSVFEKIVPAKEEDHEDDAPLVKPAAQRRNVRAGFIIDDDSD